MLNKSTLFCPKFVSLFVAFFTLFCVELYAGPCEKAVDGHSSSENSHKSLQAYFSEFLAKKNKPLSEEEVEIVSKALMIGKYEIFKNFITSKDSTDALIVSFTCNVISGDLSFKRFFNNVSIRATESYDARVGEEISTFVRAHELGHLFSLISLFKAKGPHRVALRSLDLSLSSVQREERAAIKFDYEFIRSIPVVRRQQVVNRIFDYLQENGLLFREALKRDFYFDQDSLGRFANQIQYKYLDFESAKSAASFHSLIYVIFHSFINSELPFDAYYDLAIRQRGYSSTVSVKRKLKRIPRQIKVWLLSLQDLETK